MRRFAVLAERLAVIGRQDDERVCRSGLPQDRLEQRLQGSIRGRDIILISLSQKGVGNVRLEEVNPEKNGLHRLGVHPSAAAATVSTPGRSWIEERRPARASTKLSS